MIGFIECDILTFTDGSVVSPGGEHLGHPLTRDALGSLKHMVSITGELNRRPDTAAFRREQTQESMKEFSHACPRIDQTVSCQSKCQRRNIIRSYTLMEITVRFIYSGDGRRFGTILSPSLYKTASGRERDVCSLCSVVREQCSAVCLLWWLSIEENENIFTKLVSCGGWTAFLSPDHIHLLCESFIYWIKKVLVKVIFCEPDYGCCVVILFDKHNKLTLGRL